MHLLDAFHTVKGPQLEGLAEVGLCSPVAFAEGSEVRAAAQTRSQPSPLFTTSALRLNSVPGPGLE